MKPMKLCLWALIFLLFSVSLAWSLSGRVVGVSDGDTITVLADSQQIKVRLYGIDTPEKGQAFGRVAREHLKTLLTPAVNVEVVDMDRYGRSVGLVLTESGININRAMVMDGFAWVYGQYCKKAFCVDWKALEEQARASRIGLWKESDPMPPWEWRRKSKTVTSKGKTVSTKKNLSLVSQGDVGAAVLHGNSQSHIVHRPECRYYECKNCAVIFQSIEEAERAGYRRCKLCW